MNKTLEYMAYGIPVVATDLRETRRCAGTAAEYVPDGDPATMAKTIGALLDDPLRRRRMGLVGRMRIERELAWPDQAQRYVSVYSRLVGNAARV
jgi:glycosyltransferase involved in cell wall biosynthesis